MLDTLLIDLGVHGLGDEEAPNRDIPFLAIPAHATNSLCLARLVLLLRLRKQRMDEDGVVGSCDANFPPEMMMARYRFVCVGTTYNIMYCMYEAAV